MDTLFLLPILIGASILCIALTLTYRPATRWFSRNFGRRKTHAPLFQDEAEDEQPAPAPAYMPSKGLFNDFKAHVADIGGYIFGFELARLVCLAALLALSIYATTVAQAPRPPKDRLSPLLLTEDESVLSKRHRKHGKKKHKQNSNDLSTQEWAEFSVAGFYVSPAERRSCLSTESCENSSTAPRSRSRSYA